MRARAGVARDSEQQRCRKERGEEGGKEEENMRKLTASSNNQAEEDQKEGLDMRGGVSSRAE